MQQTPFLRYTLTALSAITLIPLTYTLITRQDADVTTVDIHSTPAIHRQVTSSHSCSHCAECVPADRQAAQARKTAASGLIWEKSSSDPASSPSSMRITSGMPLAKDFQPGSRQQLTLEDGTELIFDVQSHYVHVDGTVAVDAILPGQPEGKLHMQWNEKDHFFLGQIEYTKLAVAYEITRADDGGAMITRRSIDQLVCSEVNHTNQEVTFGLPAVDETLAAEADATDADSASTEEEGASLVPTLNSYPSAAAVLYLDFDGQVVENTSWGSNITAVSPGYSAAKITDIWKRVAADMEAFNLNVTTEEAVYLNAASNSRIRCIITPSNGWYGGSSSAGGVAKLGSFTWSGDTPCWIFSNNLLNGTKYIAEACSHETGHTFGLSHDGKSGVSTYYAGHGSGDVGWAPIMGNGYYKTLTQWSKGEYSSPTNTQDDLSIITSNSNGFGYRADDHVGKSRGATAMPANASHQVSGSGVIETQGDVDVFTVDSAAGSLSLDITPTNTITNVDLEVELYDDKGNLLATANPATLLSASISTTVEGGTYFLHVRATGYGTANTGSSDYASLGAYKISGEMAAAVVLSPYEMTVASLDQENQGLEADPDQDGLSNLVEHVMGTDPAIANMSQRFTSIESAGAAGIHFLLDLPSEIPADAIYVVEATCDMAANDWSSIASRSSDGQWTLSGAVTVTEEAGPDGKRRFRITEPSGESVTCRFMRVRFEIETGAS